MRALIEIVERAYDVDAPTASWLEAIRSSAARMTCHQFATQVYTFSVSPEGRFEPGDIASDPEWEEALRRAHRLADPAVIRQLYLHGPGRTVRQAAVGRPDDAGYQAVIASGISDVTLALGVDPTGSGCAVAFLHRYAQPLSRATRHALERVSAHLASSRRLRCSLDRLGRGRNPIANGDAVLSPIGEVLHAEREARSGDARRALRDAARRIDRARARREGSSPEEALALWRALVEGRWSLVERFESDGRRILVAHRNDPASRAHCGLDERERKVVALLAVGHSLKLCAYELGRAESTVSELARTAMRKMGVRSRAELVELHGSILSEPGVVSASASQ